MNEVETMTDQQAPRPLPKTQGRMADLIVGERVAYDPSTARWYLGPGPDDVAAKGDGRALREMRMADLVEVDTSGEPDERGAYPVKLTETGQARYR